MAEMLTEVGAEAAFKALAPGAGWASRPSLTSSDVLVSRNKDSLAADARDAARANPYGRSASRSTVDAIVGSKLTLQLEPDYEELGVSDEEAASWADMVERRWELAANSSSFHMDAQRRQTFSGLMRTAYNSFYVSGETLGTIEWKPSTNGDRTCLHLLDPERLSDPRGISDRTGMRRMGVERDKHGSPIAYHIREQHPSDGVLWGRGIHTWRRVPRYTGWGRLNVIHFNEHDRPDMTRGLSSFTTALLPMRLLNDYVTTELESAAIRATYAAVIESELDYEDAMKVIGDDHAATISSNPILDVTLRMLSENAKFYRGQDFKFGKSKIAHLMPNEKLKMVQGTQSASALKDFNSVNLYTIASALGVDYATLTKNYSDTNYSGARAALFDVWRSYEVRRESFIESVPIPFFVAWLEEQVALRGTIPMLGSKSFYEVRDAISRCTFETWGKPRLDPLKENQADQVLYDMGALSLREICAQEGRDWRRVLLNRKRQKDEMAKLGLVPEDIDWSLRGQIKKPGAEGEGAGPEGGASTGTSGN